LIGTPELVDFELRYREKGYNAKSLFDGGEVVFVKHLKQAAREWIEELNKGYINEEGMTSLMIQCNNDKMAKNQAIIDWIKHFFNLEK
jgi:hypothetical protein